MTTTITTVSSSTTMQFSVSGETLQFVNNETNILAYWKQINAFETMGHYLFLLTSTSTTIGMPPVPSSIPSPHAFDPQTTSWKSYRDRIQFYFEANRIVELKEKKALFLWSIGNTTYQLLENLISPRLLTNEDVQFTDLLHILNLHYDDTKNIMTSTYDFYSCFQKDGQSFSDWKAELCEKLRHCGFTTSKLKDKPQERALRDMYVIGVRNPKIRQALLKEQDPDLEKAEKIIQLAERLYEDVQHFGTPSARVDVPVAKIQYQQPKKFFNQSSKKNNNKQNDSITDPCATCGSTEHIRGTCKYRNYTCNHCERVGHLARVCRSRPKEKEDESSVRVTATIFKLDHVDQVTQPPVSTTTIPLRINGHDCTFELDTGALHTIFTVKDWKFSVPVHLTNKIKDILKKPFVPSNTLTNKENLNVAISKKLPVKDGEIELIITRNA